MTGEGKVEGRRKRFHQRSKSSIGDYTSPMLLDPVKDVHSKGSPKAGKTASKEFSRSWFKSRKPTQPYPASDAEVEDAKPLQQQRVVQGLYRDDDGGPSPKILATAHSAARDAVKEFAKDLLAQLKAGDPEAALAMESRMRQHLHLPLVSPPTNLKFVAQSYIAHHFFADFENASFGIPNPGEKPWEVQDHMRRCFAQFQSHRKLSQTVSTLLRNETNGSFLSQFCAKKFRAIVPSDMQSAALLGGDARDHPDLETGVWHPDTPLYRSFLCAAASVWLLQRVALSFEQKIATIFPTRGDAFQRRFMAPVVPGVGEDTEEEESDAALQVAFAVFPGFRVSESIVESSVFIVETPKTPPKIDSTPLETASENPNDSSPSATPGPLKPSKTGEQGLLQKIRSKFIRKKTLVKGTVVAESSTPAPAPAPAPQPPSEEPESAPAPSVAELAPARAETVAELAPARPETVAQLAPARGETVAELAPTRAETVAELAPARGETVASSEPEQSPPTEAVTAPAAASVPGRLIPQSPDLEEEGESYAPGFASAVEGDDRLYVPRADKAGLEQLPLRSPRLSSVD